MNLALLSFNYLVAEQDMRCDAFGVRMDLAHSYTIEQTEKGVGTWYKAWRGIRKGETYLRYEFAEVDEFSGEVTNELFFNCKVEMNNIMAKNGLYPEYIKSAFKNYKNNN